MVHKVVRYREEIPLGTNRHPLRVVSSNNIIIRRILIHSLSRVIVYGLNMIVVGLRMREIRVGNKFNMIVLISLH